MAVRGVLGHLRGPAQGLTVWVVAKRVQKVGAEITMGLAPLCPCLPLFLLVYSFWKKFT